MFSTCFIGLRKNRDLASSLKLTFYINCFKYASLFTVFLSLWLNFSGFISNNVILVILIINTLVMSIRSFLATLPRTYIDGQIGDIMESIQFFLIALKYMKYIQLSWGSVITIYSYFVYFVAVFGVLSCFLLPIMLGMSTFHPRGSNDRMVLLFTSWIFFHISWKGLTFYYLFQNFKIFLLSKGLQPGNYLYSPDPSFFPMCYLFLIGGLINFMWFYQQKGLFCRLIAIRLMVITKSTGVKREIIKVPFDMKIMRAGTNYFKKLISTRKIPETFEIPDNGSITECMICCGKESNVLIRPCNHGGICESCIITYLGTNNSCPNCKSKISKIYVMDYNKDLNKYYGTKVLTLV